MTKQSLSQIARTIVSEGRGILAADESTGTIQKRLTSIDVENNEENRRSYRELLFTTAGSGKFISGVILFDETIRQKSKAGKSFVEVLKEQGTLAGIKVDKGAKNLTGFPGEQITEGLDGLRERLAEYQKLGATFTKWRAVIDIGAGIPTDFCIEANAHALARYAALSQEAGLVPIVEPEVLMDGDHGLERCAEVTERTHRVVFDELYRHRVQLDGMLLKPNMIIPGKKHAKKATPEEVGDWTVQTFLKSVPAAVPGIVFLSGGQSEEEATANLNAMNARHKNLPWQLSFSYGRALQQSALASWKGKTENVAAGQKAYLHRAQCNGAARSGRYTPQMEAEGRG
jgi:fructose-bisphosphate aldolase, class I